MFCIECSKDCAMKYEKYMSIKTPCLVCARGAEMPSAECWKCARGECHFIDKDDANGESV